MSEDTLDIKCEMEEVSPSRQKLSVSVDKKSVNSEIEDICQEINQTAQVNGFRKGKVPTRIIKRRFKKQINNTAVQRLFAKATQQALEDNNISPMSSPTTDGELCVVPGEEFKFETEVDIKPDFELPEYKGIDLVDEFEEPTKEDVENELNKVQRPFLKCEEVETATEKDRLKVNVTVSVDGDVLFDQKDQYIYLDSDSLFNVKVGNLAGKKMFGGCSAGEVKEFDIDFPEDHPDAKMRGKTGRTKIDIIAVERPQEQALDDKFAKQVGFNSIEALRKHIHDVMSQDRRNGANEKMGDQMVDYLISHTDITLPELTLRRSADAAAFRAKMQMNQSGADKEYIASKAKEISEAAREETERSMKWSLIADKISETEDIDVPDNVLQTAMANVAQERGIKLSKLLQQINPEDVRENMRRKSVMQFLIDKAQINTM